MKDQQACQQLLDFRDRGVSFAAFVGNHWRRYLLRSALLAIAAFLAVSGGEAVLVGALFVMGMVFGMVVQDFSWIDAVRRTWSLTARITNWELVQQIARGRGTTNDDEYKREPCAS